MSRKSAKKPDVGDGAAKRKPKKRSRFAEHLRQLLHDPAIRIPDSGDSPEEPPPTVRSAASEQDRMALLSDKAGRLIATLATAVWRMHKRLTTENSVDDAARIKGATRHAEAALDAAKANGLTIRDYVGERYKPGFDDMTLLSKEPDPRYAVETVIQAQRPAVRLEGVRQPLQRAEVVVSVAHDVPSDGHAAEPPKPAVGERADVIPEPGSPPAPTGGSGSSAGAPDKPAS